jgi:DNA-binding response OmpR family regulator
MGNKILIVDDERPLAKALELKLTKAGYEAKAVFDGETALGELETGQYRLILLDIIMPSLDGWEILAKIKNLKLSVVVVVTSNLGQGEDIDRAKSLGAKEFLVKSDSTLEDIVKKIGSLLT